MSRVSPSLLTAAGLLAGLVSPDPAAGQGALQAVLIGRAPARNAEPFPELIAARPPTARLYLVVAAPYEIWSARGSYVHVVAYGPDFTPAAGARIFANDRPVGVTDNRGILVFHHLPPAAHGDAAAGDDAARRDEPLAILRGVYDRGEARHVGAVELETHVREPAFNGAHLYAYTDRGLYHPGQRIRVRTIAWWLHDHYEPVEGAQVEVRLLDADGELRGGGSLLTTQFGTGSFDIPLPASLPAGPYQLAVSFAGGRTLTRLRVERPALPRIRILHDAPHQLLLDGSDLFFTVNLVGLGGTSPRQGQLGVTVEAGGKAWFSERRPMDGSAAYRFTVPHDALAPRVRRDGRTVSLAVTATDASGHADTLHHALRLVTQPYRARLLADEDRYAPGETARVRVELRALDGSPVRGELVRLFTEPADPPGPIRTDRAGRAVFTVPVSADGAYVEALVGDEPRALASLELRASAEELVRAELGGPTFAGRRVPIEVRLAAGLEPVESVLHASLVDSSGALVAALALPLSRRAGRWVARGSFMAPAWGGGLLTLFGAAKRQAGANHAGTVGLLSEGLRLAVEPGSELAITLTGLPASARPGQTIKVSGRVTDGTGRGPTAVVGAAVSDADSLCVIDPIELPPATRFYDPPLKVLATTGAERLTWPVLSRNWGVDRIDVGLPPFGFAPGASEEASDTFVDVDGATRSVHGTDSGVTSASPAAASSPPPWREPVSMPALGGAPPQPWRRPPRDGKARPAQITLRNEPPKTTLWLPELLARSGRFSFPLTLPEATGAQAITVVASDPRGAVGSTRRELTVRPELSAHWDPPARLRLGDELDLSAAVRNHRDEPVTATVSLACVRLAIANGGDRRLELPAGGIMSASFRVTAAELGEAKCAANVRAGAIHQRSSHRLRVLPAGTPRVEIVAVGGEEPRGQAATIQASANTTARVSLALPGTSAVARDLAALVSSGPAVGRSGYLMPGARAALAYRLVNVLAPQAALTEEHAQALQDAIAEDLVLLLASDDGDGGYGFAGGRPFSPHLTARALEGLTAARETTFPVDGSTLAAIGSRLLGSLDDDASIGGDDPAWWAGAPVDRQMALTALVFRLLAEAGPDAVPVKLAGEFERLRVTVGKFVNLTDDPLTIANAGLGMLAYETNFMGMPLEAVVARRYARRLLEVQRDGRWTPSWFSSAAGTLEATATAIELLILFDPERAAALVPAARDFLFGAPRRLAGCHEAAATIAVVRALGLLPHAAAEPPRGSVSIELNGKLLAKRTFDPSQPLAAALDLAGVDLTAQLQPGANALLVRSTGTLSPAVFVERTAWVAEAAGEGLTATRRLEQQAPVGLGESISVELVVRAEKRAALIAITEPIPSNARVEIDSLERLVAERVIAGYDLTEELTLYLPELAGEQRLTYRLLAIRSGRALMPPTRLCPLQRPAAATISGETMTLSVQP